MINKMISSVGVGVTSAGGTGTLYFQSNDTSGGRSDIVSVTVTITATT